MGELILPGKGGGKTERVGRFETRGAQPPCCPIGARLRLPVYRDNLDARARAFVTYLERQRMKNGTPDRLIHDHITQMQRVVLESGHPFRFQPFTEEGLARYRVHRAAQKATA